MGGSVRLSRRGWSVRGRRCVHGMNIHEHGSVRGLRCVRGMNVHGHESGWERYGRRNRIVSENCPVFPCKPAVLSPSP